MPVLIDGNNLLYAARDAEALGPEVSRSMLCDRLGAWAQRRREAVHVVFDGPKPTPELAAQIGHPDIQVSYSGGGVTADAVLKELIANDSAARRLIVVSTDREIRRAAKSRRARSIRSDEFWVWVRRDLATPEPEPPAEPEEKEAGLSPDGDGAVVA